MRRASKGITSLCFDTVSWDRLTESCEKVQSAKWKCRSRYSSARSERWVRFTTVACAKRYESCQQNRGGFLHTKPTCSSTNPKWRKGCSVHIKENCIARQLSASDEHEITEEFSAQITWHMHFTKIWLPLSAITQGLLCAGEMCMSRQFRTDQHRGEAQKLPFNGYTPYSPDRLTPQKKTEKTSLLKSNPVQQLSPQRPSTTYFQNPFHASSLAEQPFCAVFLKLHQHPFFWSTATISSISRQRSSAAFVAGFYR